MLYLVEMQGNYDLRITMLKMRAIGFNIIGVKKLPYEFAYCDNKDLIPNSASTTEEAHDNFQVYLSRAAKEAAVSEGITRSTNDTSVNLTYSPIKCCDGQRQLCHGTNEIVQVYDPKERLFVNVTLNGVFGTITVSLLCSFPICLEHMVAQPPYEIGEV
ncbi:unnamed protein product [Strongylus vulgaris]|uniref:Uncharacterized protein n=1 Tax=Strongylus vulgaris TaxID=40348 RepID=A0A3P7JA84_STRVU|nr:unnamed protein product [Strongylus vulgaris]